ncbi:hypothetical protein [Nostoc sp. 'Lobaria pulmonaria (5183) cyanobiont']|uniref:hypothetical protein n=1 Tax=Nostoc sp. 'Lobaria pulmonaria (5183) cyanobiont' TaxID=1618022 RepID=UPI000CF33DB1|nr:hypothetical protein [Nostoc sp. 'Lobaria pulmonaria (5183) cyanobiont']AVH69579.1 hypothetical protein NLP_0711 [Nostoc sp. 'Lobaria pulmonaria (5183) cyanobiont']
MKSEQEREQLIKEINILLNQAYDSTLDEIYTLIQTIEEEEEEEDLKAYDKAKTEANIDNSLLWEEAKKELKTGIKKKVA